MSNSKLDVLKRYGLSGCKSQKKKSKSNVSNTVKLIDDELNFTELKFTRDDLDFNGDDAPVM